MPIRTAVATHFLWRKIIEAVICAVLAVWGWYDLNYTLPNRRLYAEEHAKRVAASDALQEKANQPGGLTPEEKDLYEQLTNWIKDAPVPKVVRAYDEPVQWVFISCILWVPWCFWRIHVLRRRVYELNEQGDLSLPGGRVWKRDDIKSIDMSIWMDKSIATVEHVDGSREKLDAYLHKRLELIIGHIAHRFEPDRWQPDGRKATPKDEPGEAAAPDGASDDSSDADSTGVTRSG